MKMRTLKIYFKIPCSGGRLITLPGKENAINIHILICNNIQHIRFSFGFGLFPIDFEPFPLPF